MAITSNRAMEGSEHDHHQDSRRFHSRPVAARHLVGAVVELFSQAGYAPVAPGWPGDSDTVEASRANPDGIADHITKSTVKQYRHSSAVRDLEEFSDRGHSLTIDHGWREVADACLTWLAKQGL